MSIKPEDFDDVWGYKYVCFEGGTVLFLDAGDYCVNHIDVVNEHPELKPVSAGVIKVNNKHWYISEGGSRTAKLPQLETDEETIGKVLEPLGFVYDHDLKYKCYF